MEARPNVDLVGRPLHEADSGFDLICACHVRGSFPVRHSVHRFPGDPWKPGVAEVGEAADPDAGNPVRATRQSYIHTTIVERERRWTAPYVLDAIEGKNDASRTCSVAADRLGWLLVVQQQQSVAPQQHDSRDPKPVAFIAGASRSIAPGTSRSIAPGVPRSIAPGP